MNRRLLAVTLAAVTVAGAAAAVVPQHAASVAALAAATVVVVLALLLLVLAGPLVTAEPLTTALDGVPAGRAPALDPQGLRDARRDLAGRRGAGALPPAVWERIVVAAVLRLQRCGIDVDSPSTREQGRALLHPSTWALLVTPPAPGSTVDAAGAAAIVHRTLDELDALVPRHGGHP